jgi:long-chain acyl-CoA synthetase
MPGYYRNQKETDEMIIDGWLHTGDIGELDKNGCIIITDRKKSLIKTASGKYISLTHIEDTLINSEYIEQVIAFASDEKHFVSALIVPDFEKLEEAAVKLHIHYSDIYDIITNDTMLNFFESEIDVTQKHLAKYERVRKFALLGKPFTIESGELTPTLKLKRRVIEERNKDLVERFYKK